MVSIPASRADSRRRSLADRLTQTLIQWVGAVWITAMLAVVWYVDREINTNFDSELVESAHRMIDIAIRDFDHEKATGQPLELPLIGRDPLIEEDHVVFQLVDDSGRVLMRSQEAPSTRFPVRLETGFQDLPPWRIYTVKHPKAPQYLLLADPLDERLRHRWQTLIGLAVPLIAMLPLFAWGLRRIARRELSVVERLEAQIAERGSTDLRPLELTALPSELRSVGEHVNRLLERLGQALDAERALAANAAHELRTPLAAARLRLVSALDGELRRDDIEAAVTALSRLGHRTEKLLQLSRAESAAAMTREEVDLARLAAVVVDEMWDSGSHADRIDLDVNAPGTRPASGDADSLAIALRNLIENALRYSGESRVEVTIEAPCSLVVRDHGPGVPAEALHRLRDRHVRAGADRAGYGLGLSIVSSIAERQGAGLELHSPRRDGLPGLEVILRLQPWDGPVSGEPTGGEGEDED